MTHIRIRTALRGLGLTVVLWSFLAIVAEYFGAHWPHSHPDIPTCFNPDTFQYIPTQCKQVSGTESWSNLLLLVLVVQFLWLKSWMMGQMTRTLDRLGASLIAANLMFSVLYLYFIASTLFPHLSMNRTPTYALRALLVTTLIWGMVELLRVQDPDDELEAQQ